LVKSCDKEAGSSVGADHNTWLLCCQVHRLVVTGDDGRIQGILSLSDLLHFIILKPSSKFSRWTSGVI